MQMRSLSELPAPLGLPVVGNAWQLDAGRLHLSLEKWARALGPFFTLRLGSQRILVVGETTAIHEVLQNRPSTYRRLSRFEQVFEELGSSGVFSAEGERWKQQRQLVMAAFSARQQREIYPSIATFTDRLQRHWLRGAARQEVVDVRGDLMRYTVDVTSMLVFGRDLGTLENPDAQLQQHLNRIFRAILQRVNAVFPHWRYFKLPRDRAIDRSLAAVH